MARQTLSSSAKATAFAAPARHHLHRGLTVLIALVWLVNGLFCKVLDLVPRHQEIVARILGDGFASPITRVIGLFEVLMAAWVLSGFRARLCAVTQICLVLAMNVMEFTIAPDLLLWGRFNILFAALFALLVYYNTFQLKQPRGEGGHALAA